MAKPFYRSGESFAVVHDVLSCSGVVDNSTATLFHFDFDRLQRQVISSLSDYSFGYASMHTYPSIGGMSPAASESLVSMTRIQLDEYLFSSSYHKPIET